jgi:hypothetical protein
LKVFFRHQSYATVSWQRLATAPVGALDATDTCIAAATCPSCTTAYAYQAASAILRHQGAGSWPSLCFRLIMITSSPSHCAWLTGGQRDPCRRPTNMAWQAGFTGTACITKHARHTYVWLPVMSFCLTAVQVRLLKNASSVEEARARKPLTFNTGSKDPQHIWNVSAGLNICSHSISRVLSPRADILVAAPPPLPCEG